MKSIDIVYLITAVWFDPLALGRYQRPQGGGAGAAAGGGGQGGKGRGRPEG